MVYAIEEISEVSGGRIAVIVGIWNNQAERTRGAHPFKIESFVMALPPRGTEWRVVLDQAGQMKRSDGVFVDPESVTDEDEAIGWEREAFVRDYRQQIEDTVEAHLQRVIDPETPVPTPGKRPQFHVGASRNREANRLRIKDIPEVDQAVGATREIPARGRARAGAVRRAR